MQLLVDIGNTRLKWRWSRRGELLPGGAEALPPAGAEVSFFHRFWGAVAAPERVVVSDVLGEPLRGALRNWTMHQWGREPCFVTSTTHVEGVTNGYDIPSSLGVDRWCALIGARSVSMGPLCVVDCGTAITVDLLSTEGQHRGGLICPGLSTMIRSLTESAGGLRVEVKATRPAAPLGRSTVECIQAGILAAAAGMVEYTLGQTAFPDTGTLLLTGGDAELLGSALKRPVRIEPDLVFRGLAEIGART